MLVKNNVRYLVVLCVLLILQPTYSQDTGTITQPILGGEPVAVGELEAIGSIGNCTATLIEQDLVLTAAHCVCVGETTPTGCVSQRSFTLTNVRSVDDPNTRRNIQIPGSVRVHPDYTSDGWLSHDFATIRLHQPASELVLGVNPIQLELPTHRPKLGDNLTIVGFGTAPPCSPDLNHPNAGKDKVTLPLHEISTGNVTLRIGTTSAGACPGDSGGPALNSSGKIVGVASSLPGNYDPTDLAYRWIYRDTHIVDGKGTHGSHFERRDEHQFNLESVYPITENGRLTYEWDNVRDPGQSSFIRRLNVKGQSNFPIVFKRKVMSINLDKIDHTVVKDETISVSANNVHGSHYEQQDKHAFYLESVYPITENGRLTYEWDNVRDPGQSSFIRRLVVKNKSNFRIRFKLKVVKVNFSSPPVTTAQHSQVGLSKTDLLDETKTVEANGKHGFHFEFEDRHRFYLESVYPITENGRLTYEWDNVRDPGESRYIRRLNVINKSNFPVRFKIKVIGVTYNSGFVFVGVQQ